jgi:hypothetical protein
VAVAAGEHASTAVPCQHSEAAGGGAARPASVRAALGLVASARTWLRGQRGVLKERQAALLEAQAEWRRALAAWEGPAAAGGAAGGEGGAPGSSGAGGGRAEALAGLRCLKAVLQDQVHTLNADARTLRRLKEQVGVWGEKGAWSLPSGSVSWSSSCSTTGRALLVALHWCSRNLSVRQGLYTTTS